MNRKITFYGLFLMMSFSLLGSQGNVGIWLSNRASKDVVLRSGANVKKILPNEQCFIPCADRSRLTCRLGDDGDFCGLALDKSTKFFDHKDVRCAKITLQNFSDADIQALSKKSYVLFNATGKKLYCAWYKTPKNSKEPITIFTRPRVIEKEDFIDIYKPGGIQKKKTDVGLILSKNSLEMREQNYPESSKCYEVSKLKYGEQYVVGLENASLELYADHKEKFTLVNTTNVKLECREIELLKDGRFKETGVFRREIAPQHRTFISQPPGRSIDDQKTLRLILGPVGTFTEDGFLSVNPEKLLMPKLSSFFVDDTFYIERKVTQGQDFEIICAKKAPHRIIPNLLHLLVPRIQKKYPAIELARSERKILQAHNVVADQPGDDENVLIVRNFDALAPEDREQMFIDQRLKIVEPAIQNFMQDYRSDEYDAEANEYYVEKPITKEVPKIAMVFPGGGYRAMIGTVGYLEGAEKVRNNETSLLDCICYTGGLSGSTWALVGYLNFLSSDKQDEDEENPEKRNSVKDFADDLCQRVNHKVTHSPFFSRLMGLETLTQLFRNVVYDSDFDRRSLVQDRFRQFTGWSSFYGHALAHALFGCPESTLDDPKSAHHLTFSSLQAGLENGTCPLPICVAVDSEHNTPTNHHWIEFSPYYTGLYCKQVSKMKGDSNSRSLAIPTSLFGSRMRDKELIHKVPEYTLADLMGVWGLAFAIDSSDVANEASIYESMTVASLALSDYTVNSLSNMFKKYRRKKIRINERMVVDVVPNFTYETDGSDAKDAVSSREDLHLIDGGLVKKLNKDKDIGGNNTHNFASVPMLARKADVLIMCDTTYSPKEKIPAHLIAARDEALEMGFEFPTISQHILDDINDVDKFATLIDTGVGPIIVYIKIKRDTATTIGFEPDAKSSPHLKTENFRYKPHQFYEYKNHARGIMSKPSVVKVIKEAVYRSQRRPVVGRAD